MALYFKERIDEQKKKEEDPLKDKITFTYPWIIEILPPNDAEEINFQKNFVTSYKFGNEVWSIKLSTNEIRIGTYFALNGESELLANIWNENSCFISYNLYYDNDMRFLLYSSTKIGMEKLYINADIFQTPDGFMKKFEEAFNQRKIAKIVIFVELQLLTKYFYRPYDIPGYLSMNLFEDYPEDIDQDDRFQFLEDGDFVIKCSDGSMPACRNVLIRESKYMIKHFEKSEDHELVVEYSIDVVKPIIIYLHTECFKMPKVYDLDYAKRLLNAVDFFELKYESIIKTAIEHWLYKKIVKEYQDFDSILQWTSIAIRHSFIRLKIMLATIIADKFYFKWQQTFPENARNIENPLFFSIFGSESSEIFELIDGIFEKSFLTNIILD